MANRALINYYAKLVQKEQMKITDIDEDIRDQVVAVIHGETISSSHQTETVSKVSIPEEVTKQGALNLSNILISEEIQTVNGNHHMHIEIPHDKIVAHDEDDNVITFNALNPAFDIRLFDIICPRIYDLEGAVIPHTEKVIADLTFKVRDNVDTIQSGDKLFRIDFIETSDDYEDMRFTVYVSKN